jgi:tripartite-type tricarboxylate transporter receptor subunit TctC
MIARWIAALTLTLAWSAAVSAQDWPVRPITMVIPFAAGGPTDVLGRIMAERMSQTLGQQVVVENVGGAGGMTGAQRVAQARPDGYQFVLGTVGTHAVNQTLYKRPLYDASTDFLPSTKALNALVTSRIEPVPPAVRPAASQLSAAHG